MNFNPQNEQGILGLVAALKNGMSPDSAFGAFQMLQQDQAADIAARQERLGGLAELLMGAASQGTPYAGAEALADAAPGPMGPAVQQMLSALYPNSGPNAPTPDLNYLGHVMDGPEGSKPTPTGMTDPSPMTGMQYQTPMSGEQALSPTFVPQGPSPTEAIAMQNMEQEQAIMADLTALQADAAAKKADGWTLDQFLSAAQKSNPQLFAVAPEQAKQVLEGTFGTSAYDMMGLQPSV